MTLSEQQRAQLSALLHQQADQLEREMAALTHSSAASELTLPQHANDGENRAQTDVLNDDAIAQTVRTQQTLVDTRRALQRLELGQYGQCVSCGGQIPFERLRASPSATFCIACQTALEREQAR